MSGRLLATDLDGTFIGDDTAMMKLWSDLVSVGATVVFATGRHLASIEDFYRAADTELRADACITMVGTEVWRRAGDGYELDQSWMRRISDGWDAAAVRTTLAGVAGLEPQPDEWQSDHKCSYFFDSPQTAGAVERRLAEAGIDAKVIASADRFLDVLPSKAGKGSALVHLITEIGIAPSEVVVAGDTGNDLDMMRPELGFRSIVVGNAAPELRALDGPQVYRAKAPYAAGIREGLANFGWPLHAD